MTEDGYDCRGFWLRPPGRFHPVPQSGMLTDNFRPGIMGKDSDTGQASRERIRLRRQVSDERRKR